MNIIAGVILLTGVVTVVPSVGKYLKKACKALAAYQVPIGIIAVIVGILGLLGTVSGGTIASLMAIVAGIVLAISVFRALPQVGKELEKIVAAISSVQIVFGIITLVVGIVYL